MTKNITWQCSEFEDLSVSQLYALLKLRQDVFVVEQACVYQDIDALDQSAWHVQGFIAGELVAYSRVLGPNTRFEEPSIGRVIVAPSFRIDGLGYQLMSASMALCHEKFPARPIRISAQVHLKDFYGKLGFSVCSDVYDEDGIDHVEMISSD